MNSIWQFIVRESDTWIPDVPRIITSDADYLDGYWNSNKQISIAEDNSYVITLPDGITTNRHVYYNERIDMIGYISANVIAEAMVAPVQVSNEKNADGTPFMRKYQAQRCTIGYHEGCRMLLLVEGGGL